MVEFRRDLVVRSGSGLGSMPDPPLGIDLGVDGLSQRLVRPSSVVGGRQPVGRSADKRMSEPDAGSELGQFRVGCRGGRFGADAQESGRPPDQRGVSGRVRRRDEQQLASFIGQGGESPSEARFDGALEGHCAGELQFNG